MKKILIFIGRLFGASIWFYILLLFFAVYFGIFIGMGYLIDYLSNGYITQIATEGGADIPIWVVSSMVGLLLMGLIPSNERNFS